MRICLIGDTHGFVPGLEAALDASNRHAPDLIVHCGDFLTSAFSPDPPGETIDLLRSENVQVIYGNNEVYFRDWGTPRWESTVAARRRRPDSPDYFLPAHCARAGRTRSRRPRLATGLAWRALAGRRSPGRLPRHARQPVRHHLGHQPGLHPRLHRPRDRCRAVPALLSPRPI